MKEWLKEFVVFHHGFKPLDSEIDQYLRDHPLPLPTDEEIESVADKYGFRVPYDGSKDFYDDAAVKHFIRGAKWMREKMEENV